MHIILIEDELKASKSLKNLLLKLRPEAAVIAQLQSIEASVAYFTQHAQPDLLFMDIQLSDGLCFEIFKSVKIHCPIVFCTAYGEYAMDAIKSNGIDYLLKPFSETDLNVALAKVEGFKNFFQKHTIQDLERVLASNRSTQGKKSFLIFKNNKYSTLETEQIAYVHIGYGSASLVNFQGVEFSMNQSLDQIQSQLSSTQFFRLNRQYLINFSAIKEVEHYFSRKLFVRLKVATPDKLLIGKEKTTVFLKWLAER